MIFLILDSIKWLYVDFIIGDRYFSGLIVVGNRSFLERAILSSS
ncbi:hypothetical protein [Nostoc sp. 'Peltigera malacea cyanobiont' DB3992]|nr:hypothetical protein [Nostoc sp. 'Peltigera malacea cyanobiont' DB3992]